MPSDEQSICIYKFICRNPPKQTDSLLAKLQAQLNEELGDVLTIDDVRAVLMDLFGQTFEEKKRTPQKKEIKKPKIEEVVDDEESGSETESRRRPSRAARPKITLRDLSPARRTNKKRKMEESIPKRKYTKRKR